MSDWKIRWTHGATAIEVDLVDTAGPLNDYEFADPNAVVPHKGTFTNQTERIVPAGGGWIMNEFDIDADYPTGKKGRGEVDITHVGTFPKGEFEWEVLKKL